METAKRNDGEETPSSSSGNSSSSSSATPEQESQQNDAAAAHESGNETKAELKIASETDDDDEIRPVSRTSDFSGRDHIIENNEESVSSKPHGEQSAVASRELGKRKRIKRQRFDPGLLEPSKRTRRSTNSRSHGTELDSEDERSDATVEEPGNRELEEALAAQAARIKAETKRLDDREAELDMRKWEFECDRIKRTLDVDKYAGREGIRMLKQAEQAVDDIQTTTSMVLEMVPMLDIPDTVLGTFGRLFSDLKGSLALVREAINSQIAEKQPSLPPTPAPRTLVPAEEENVYVDQLLALRKDSIIGKEPAAGKPTSEKKVYRKPLALQGGVESQFSPTVVERYPIKSAISLGRSAVTAGLANDEPLYEVAVEFDAIDLVNFCEERFLKTAGKNLIKRRGRLFQGVDDDDATVHVQRTVYAFKFERQGAGRSPVCALCGGMIKRDEYRGRARRLTIAGQPICTAHSYHAQCLAILDEKADGVCVGLWMGMHSNCQHSYLTQTKNSDENGGENRVQVDLTGAGEGQDVTQSVKKDTAEPSTESAEKVKPSNSDPPKSRKNFKDTPSKDEVAAMPPYTLSEIIIPEPPAAGYGIYGFPLRNLHVGKPRVTQSESPEVFSKLKPSNEMNSESEVKGKTETIASSRVESSPLPKAVESTADSGTKSTTYSVAEALQALHNSGSSSTSKRGLSANISENKHENDGTLLGLASAVKQVSNLPPIVKEDVFPRSLSPAGVVSASKNQHETARNESA